MRRALRAPGGAARGDAKESRLAARAGAAGAFPCAPVPPRREPRARRHPRSPAGRRASRRNPRRRPDRSPGDYGAARRRPCSRTLSTRQQRRSVLSDCEHMFAMAYVELHCHSAFSFLDGVSLPDEIAAAALELGYGSLALTDHNSVSGSMEFAVAAKAD